MSCGCGGTNRSDEGLNLSGSWQQGHSATYNTLSRSYVVCKGFYPSLGGNYVTRRPPRLIRHEGLANDTCLWGPEGPYCWSAIERWAHASLLARILTQRRSVIIQRTVASRHWLFNQEIG